MEAACCYWLRICHLATRIIESKGSEGKLYFRGLISFPFRLHSIKGTDSLEMARLLSSPTKYFPSEWHSSNQTNYKLSEAERTTSERLRAECERLHKETEETTRRTQKEVEHKFSQRILDIYFWKEELETKLKETTQEIEAVLDHKAELEKALESTNFPLQVAKSCLSFREKRQGIDLVHDEVEIQLMKVCN